MLKNKIYQLLQVNWREFYLNCRMRIDCWNRIMNLWVIVWMICKNICRSWWCNKRYWRRKYRFIKIKIISWMLILVIYVIIWGSWSCWLRRRRRSLCICSRLLVRLACKIKSIRLRVCMCRSVFRRRFKRITIGWRVWRMLSIHRKWGVGRWKKAKEK